MVIVNIGTNVMPRKELDSYYTPNFLVKSFLNKHYFVLSGRVLEPCVGEQAIADELRKHVKGTVITNDINPEVEADYKEDCREFLKREKSFDWIVTNPPFNIAHEIIPLAYEKASKGIIMLLRLSYLEPCKNRRDWLAKHPPNILVINKRVSFTGDGKSDSCTTAWFCWLKSCKDQLIDFIY